MIRREQVFVRAYKPSTESWHSVDVFTLDDESFRAFVITKLRELGALAIVSDEYCNGDEMTLWVEEASDVSDD